MSFENGKSRFLDVSPWKFGTSHICFMQLRVAGLRKKLCYKNEMEIYGWISLVITVQFVAGNFFMLLSDTVILQCRKAELGNFNYKSGHKSKSKY